MHEVAVAAGILEAVRAETAARTPVRAETAARTPVRAVKVGIRIGEMAGIDPESLAFCFEALVAGTDLEPLELEVERGSADELEFCYLELEPT